MLKKSNLNLILIVAVLLGFLFNYFFFDKPLGVSFLIYTALLVGGLIGLSRYLTIKAKWTNAWLIIPLLFFATMTFVRANSFLVFLNVSLTFLLLLLVIYFYTTGNVAHLSLFGYWMSWLKSVSYPVVEAPKLIRETVDLTAVREQSSHRVTPILRGVALATPILLLFTILLASADLVFAEKITDFFALDFFPELFKSIRQLVVIVVVSFYLIGLFAYSLLTRSTEQEFGWKISYTFLGMTETTTILFLVNALFAIFVRIQFVYFFGGAENISEEAFTFAEYARQGFFEIVVVSIMALALLLFLETITHRHKPAHYTVFNFFASLMSVFVLIMLYAAFKRLDLYQLVYGYTQLRLYSDVYMVWLAVLLGWYIISLWVKPNMFAIGAFCVVLGFVATLNIINPDALITRMNLERAISQQDGIAEEDFDDYRSYNQNIHLDVSYLTTLSVDAYPILAEQWHLIPNEDEKSAVKEYLEEEGEQLLETYPERPLSSFHLAYWNAFHIAQALVNE